MSGVRPPRALLFGEALIDDYPDRQVVAGAPLHVAAHLAARGWIAHLITRIGNDQDGRRVRNVLTRCRVGTTFVETDPELPTGRVTVELGDDNRFLAHRPAAWDAIEGPAVLPQHDALCFGTIAGRSQRSRATLERIAGSSRAPIKAVDVNLRPPDVHPEVLRACFRSATVIKLSDQELEDLTGICRLAPRAEAYFGACPNLRWLCVTRGARGAELFDSFGASWTVEGRPVSIVDTVGAGDAFTAGLIHALATGLPGRAALEAAQEAAVSVLSHRGGLPELEGVER